MPSMNKLEKVLVIAKRIMVEMFASLSAHANDTNNLVKQNHFDEAKYLPIHVNNDLKILKNLPIHITNDENINILN